MLSQLKAANSESARRCRAPVFLAAGLFVVLASVSVSDSSDVALIRSLCSQMLQSAEVTWLLTAYSLVNYFTATFWKAVKSQHLSLFPLSANIQPTSSPRSSNMLQLSCAKYFASRCCRVGSLLSRWLGSCSCWPDLSHKCVGEGVHKANSSPFTVATSHLGLTRWRGGIPSTTLSPNPSFETALRND